MSTKNGKSGAGHWQDFSTPVTLTAEQAGAIYRTIHSIKTTLSIAADHFTLLAADRKDLMALSVNDVEALLAGAVQLVSNADRTLEELHR